MSLTSLLMACWTSFLIAVLEMLWDMLRWLESFAYKRIVVPLNFISQVGVSIFLSDYVLYSILRCGPLKVLFIGRSGSMKRLFEVGVECSFAGVWEAR